MKLQLTLFIFIFSIISSAYTQEGIETDEWKIFPGGESIDESDDSMMLKNVDTTLLNQEQKYVIDTTLRLKKLDKANPKGTLKVSADPKIDKISAKMGTPCFNCPNVKIKGYRVQIMNNTKKTMIDEARARLLSTHANISNYIDYKAPYFRLRAGDFRSKLDAEKFQSEIKAMFPGCVVIQDFIELPSLEISEN